MEFLKMYWNQDANISHYSLAISILTTVIIGGCVILLVENQQTQGEILTRYHNVMRPFYHRLTLYAKVVQQCMFALRAIDKDGEAYKSKIQKLCNDFRAIAFESLMTGKDASYLDASFLASICTKANDIWYMFDRDYEIYSHLRIGDVHSVEDLRMAFLAYDRSLDKRNVDLHLLPEISGDFYVKEWQPIDNIPVRFEYFVKESKKIGKWLYACFAIEITSLVVVYLSESFDGMSLMAIDLVVLLSIIFFVISLFKFLQIKSRLLMLQF